MNIINQASTGGGGSPFWAAAGDFLVFIALVVAVLTYRLQRRAEARREARSQLALVKGVLEGMRAWADLYFKGGYTSESAAERADMTKALILNREIDQVMEVPTQALEAFVFKPGTTPLRDTTLQAIGLALWQIRKFNQLVQMQASWNVNHLDEIRSLDLPSERREGLAESAASISGLIHTHGIGSGEWYRHLMAELEAEARDLEAATR